jgi:DNA repair exonuclease SbcCD ATPase subunit
MSGKNASFSITIPVEGDGVGTGTGGSDGSTPPVADGVPTPPPSRTFTEDDIERARREEKEKMYGRLNTLEEQLSAFQKEREELERISAEQAAAEQEERKRREREDMDARQLVSKVEDEFKEQLNSVQQEWESKYEALRKESEAQQALLERERQFQALESYKSRRISEESANLMPELLDFIAGNTEEEIESSIAAVAQRTAAIVESVRGTQRGTVAKGIPATGQPAVGVNGPVENVGEQRVVTADDIRNMSMEEWKNVRERLLNSASRR